MKKQLVTISILTLLVSACAVNQQGQVVPDQQTFNKRTLLPLGAGLLGAEVCRQLFKGHGSKKGWTAACGVAGYLVSSTFVRQNNQALENNKIGETSRWDDPDGKTYSVTPTRTYYQGDTPCREFRQTVEIEGQLETLTGQACRQANGTWKLMG